MDRSKPKDWPQPARVSVERTRERIDDGFVLVGGWQIKYRPTAERRRVVCSKAYRVALAAEATARQAKRRAEAERVGG